MSKCVLSIAIPTFNRKESLTLTLEKLRPQLTKECELVILDNHSNDSTSSLLSTISSQYSGAGEITIIRHVGNVGGNENILRCIENSKGKYLWLLGDDDTPLPNAIETILIHIDENPSALVFNYYLKCPEHQIRNHSYKTYGSVDYLKHTKFLGELVFISNIVLSVKQALQNLNEAHLWQSSHVPQLIVSAMMLRGGGEAVFSNHMLVARQLQEEASDSHGSILPVAVGIGSIAFPRWTYEEAKIIKKLELWFSVYTVINQLVLLSSISTHEAKLANNYRRNILYSLRLKPFNNFQRALLYSSYLLIKYPKIALYARNIFYKLIKRSKNKINLDFKR